MKSQGGVPYSYTVELWAPINGRKYMGKWGYNLSYMAPWSVMGFMDENFDAAFWKISGLDDDPWCGWRSLVQMFSQMY